MRHQWQQHPGEDSLEAFSRGILSEAATEHVEQHLLLCEGCRQRVEVLDRFLAAMRSAVPNPALPRASEKPSSEAIHFARTTVTDTGDTHHCAGVVDSKPTRLP